jgi:hypothetical protein
VCSDTDHPENFNSATEITENTEKEPNRQETTEKLPEPPRRQEKQIIDSYCLSWRPWRPGGSIIVLLFSVNSVFSVANDFF